MPHHDRSTPGGGIDARDRGGRPLAIADLEHRFGAPQGLSVGDDLAYLSLPTHWTGVVGGRPFDEDGGWAFVLVREGDQWRVRNYAWAVTRLGFA